MMVRTPIAVIVQPLWPARAVEPAPSGLPLWLWVSLAGVVIFVVAGIVSHLAWRDRRRGAPVERAYRALVRRLRVPRASADLLRAIAEERNTPPVALLLSERAFDQALAASGARVAPEVAASLRRRLFEGA